MLIAYKPRRIQTGWYIRTEDGIQTLAPSVPISDVLWAGPRGVYVFVSAGTKVVGLKMSDEGASGATSLAKLETTDEFVRFAPPIDTRFHASFSIELADGSVLVEENVEDVSYVWPVRTEPGLRPVVTYDLEPGAPLPTLDPTLDGTHVFFMRGSVDAVDLLETLSSTRDVPNSETLFVLLVEWVDPTPTSTQAVFADVLARAIEPPSA
jgi:hypothetical protein